MILFCIFITHTKQIGAKLALKSYQQRNVISCKHIINLLQDIQGTVRCFIHLNIKFKPECPRICLLQIANIRRDL